MIVYCQTGGIGDAIMGTAVIAGLRKRYGDVVVVHFEDLVQQVIPESEKFPQDQVLDLADVGKYYPDASLAVINKFRKDNDGQLSYFYALDADMIQHVRTLRRIYLNGLAVDMGLNKLIGSIDEIDRLNLLRWMGSEDDYFADWHRYALLTGYDSVRLDHPFHSIPKAEDLGEFAIVHDSRLPGPSGRSSYVMKAWYPNRWSVFCSRLKKKMRIVQIMGGDQPLFEGAIPHTEIIGDKAVFQDYLNLLRMSRVYIGTDSWPAHAAICINDVKFVLLKGAVSKRWDHGGRYSRIIRVGDCQACEGPRGANSTCLWRAGSQQCMNMITADMVYDAVIEEIS